MINTSSPLQVTTSADLSELWRSKENICSEDACLKLIDKYFPSTSGHTPLGRGDDCAELTVTRNLAISSDAFLEDSHFRTKYFTPGEVGSKALTVAISDLAAAGAVPLGFSLVLALPPSLGENVLEYIIASMAETARKHSIVLTGGDIISGNKLGFSITVWGESVAPESSFFLRRGQAVPGEIIFVVGKLGLARAGLLNLEDQGRKAIESWPDSVLAHLAPQALTTEGATLARLAYSHQDETIGLMDVSDGLVQDLPRLLGLTGKDKKASLGAEIVLSPELIPLELYRYAEEKKLKPEELLIKGGEDFALIGTCSDNFWGHLQEIMPDSKILGRVTSKPGLFCQGENINTLGFDHFYATSCPIDESLESLSPEIDLASEEILKACNMAWSQGLMKGFNGNISARIPMPQSYVAEYQQAYFESKLADKSTKAEEEKSDKFLYHGRIANPSARISMHGSIDADIDTLAFLGKDKKNNDDEEEAYLNSDTNGLISSKKSDASLAKDKMGPDNTPEKISFMGRLKKKTDVDHNDIIETKNKNSDLSIIQSSNFENAEAFLITGTGKAKGNLKNEDLGLISLIDAKELGGARPSTEVGMHFRIYKECPDSKVIVHLHPPHMLALSLIQEEGWLDLPLVEAEIHSTKLAYVESKSAGSVDLAEAVAFIAPNYEAIWIKNHGLVVHGKNMDLALALAEELEQLAMIKLLAMQG